MFVLPPFRFDPATDTLWNGTRAQSLRPRVAALLRYFLERPGRVTSPEEILAALWRDVSVSPGVVKVHVWELRRALRDRGGPGAFIETVPRRGYRWVGPASVVAAPPAAGEPGTLLVGRAAELAELERRFALATQGERQLVLVTGEAGIGKTALTEELLRALARRPRVWVAAGQCIEHTGPGEAYLPVLSALGDLGRGGRQRILARALARHAPTWLLELPALAAGEDQQELRRAAQGASHERMLRELAEALEALTAHRTLILVLEDLQWSDASTLDLIALLARRPVGARLLVIATHRPVAAEGGAHPLPALVRELAMHGQCTELPLRFLDEAAVAAYLSARLALDDPEGLAVLARAVHERTEGNPLFVVNVVEDVLGDALDGAPVAPREAAARVRASVPASLRQAIEARVDRLAEEEQRVLEAASAVGVEFSAAALAAGLEADLEEVERRCAALARRNLLIESRGDETWPDGTASARYGFVHALYQSLLYERLGPAQRRALHRRVAERLERGHAARPAGVAAVLAVHFEQASEPARALAHLEVAAERALGKQANAEAVRHLRRALELLPLVLPEGVERAQKELALLVRLGTPLLLTLGYAEPEVIAVYGRALELCREVGDGPQKLLAFAGVYRFSLIRSELRTAHDLAGQVLRFGDAAGLGLARQMGHLGLGLALFPLGEFAAARDHFAQALDASDASVRSLLATSFGDDPAVVCLAHTAMALWFLGHPDQALGRSEEAIACARETGLPQSLVFALNYATWCRLLRREPELARPHAEELLAIATRSEFAYWVAQATAVHGWVLLDTGDLDRGTAELRRGIEAYEAIGAQLLRPWHVVRLAEAYGACGRIGEGLALLEESLARMRGRDERFYEAELYRIDGELRRASGDPAGAAERFAAALATARRQGAPSLELRAALSLARLEGGRGGARDALEQVVARFDEGLATGDLRAARALLDA